MDMYKNVIMLMLVLASVATQAQTLDAVISRWDDEFTEWDIYTLEGDQAVYEEDGEEVIAIEPSGQLVMRWQADKNWKEWDFIVDDMTGSARQLWKDDPTQWEIRIGNEVVTCRSAWRNDPSEWRITNNRRTLTWRSKHPRNFSAWQLRGDTYGSFIVHTTFVNDARDWTIIDDLDDDIPFAMKMAMTFLAIYHSVEK